MDDLHFFLIAFLFALAFPLNQFVIMFMLMARDIEDSGGRAIAYFGVFCYAILMVVYNVLLVWMLLCGL